MEIPSSIRSIRPAAGMHVEWVDEEAVVLEPETGKIHYLNPPAARLYALILEHGYEKAMRELSISFGTQPPPDELEATIRYMVERGLLVDG